MICYGTYRFLISIAPFVDIPRVSVVLARFPKLPLPWTVTIILAGFAFIVFEGGYRLRCAAICEANQALQKKDEEIHRLVWSPDRPQIELLCWAPIPSTHPEARQADTRSGVLQNGFQIKNHGEPAYDVTVESFQLGENVVAKSKPISSIAGGDTGFALIWLEGPGFSPLAQALPWFDLLLHLHKLVWSEPSPLPYAGARPNWTTSVSVIYRAGNGQGYRTEQELRYIPYQDRIEFSSPIYKIQEQRRPEGRAM